MSDPAVAPLLFPFTQHLEMCMDIEKIVNLHQVDSFCSQSHHGAFHRANSVLFAPGPNLCGEKKLFPNSERSREITNHIFGVTVHGRRINYPAAKLHKKRKNIFQLPAGIRCKIDIERLPRSQADHGQFLAR